MSNLKNMVTSTYVLDKCKAGKGNTEGVQVTIVPKNLSDTDLRDKIRAEYNRNTQQYFRLISGQTFAQMSANSNKHAGNYRPTSEQTRQWQLILQEGRASVDIAAISKTSSNGRGETREEYFDRMLLSGKSVEDIMSELKSAAEDRAEAMRAEASDTVQTADEPLAEAAG